MYLAILCAAPALRATPIYLSYTGATVHFIVPADVYSLQVELWGGGGSAGGSGGYVTALLSVTPNEDLTVNTPHPLVPLFGRNESSTNMSPRFKEPPHSLRACD